MADKIKVKLIIEVAGKPKEYVEQTLSQLLEKLKTGEGHKVIEGKVFPAKARKNFFHSLTEVVIELDSWDLLTNICIDHMPASIEILSPEKSIMSSQDMNSFFNDVMVKLHNLHNIVKSRTAENLILQKNSEALMSNLVVLSAGKEGKRTEEIAEDVGIDREQLQPFLDKYVQDKILIQEGPKYHAK